MVSKLEKLIYASEILYKKKKNISTACFLLQRYISGFIIEKNERFLRYGLDFSENVSVENPKSIELQLYLLYFKLEANDFNYAAERLSSLEKYQKYYRNNELDIYVFYVYLDALYQIKTLNTKKAYKLVKLLESLEDSNEFSVYTGLLLADLGMRLYSSSQKIADYFSINHTKNNNCVFFFLILFKYFSMKNTKIYHTEMLVPFFNWSIAHDIDVKEIIEIYSDKISFSLFDNIKLKTKLYKKYSNTDILIQVCKMFMVDMNLSKDAFYFYREAINKQIELTGLIEFLIKSAHKNGIENLGVYPVQRFLMENKLSEDMKPYMFWLILSDKKYKNLVSIYENDIIKYGINSFDNHRRGRYFYTIYNYVALKETYYETLISLYNEINKLLYEKAFLYEIEPTNSNAKFITIKEKEKNIMHTYPIEGGKAVIKALSDNFVYFLSGDSHKEILTGEIEFTGLVSNADFKLYEHLYKKSFIDENILICMSKKISSLEQIEDWHLDVLTKTLSLKSISKSFRTKLNLKAASIYFNNADYENAVKYYKEVDISYFNDKNIDSMIEAFSNTEQTEFLVNILTQKSHCVKDSTLYRVVKQIIRNDKYHKSMSNLAYELLLKSKYDPMFIHIVINYYKGSLEEWRQLNAVLKEMLVPQKEVDELIIVNSIYNEIMDYQLQELFVEFHSIIGNSDISSLFVDYCCYQILFNHIKIESFLIYTLEEIFIKTQSEILAYTLGYIYIIQEIETDKSPEIIHYIVEYIRKNRRILPLFEISNDKRFSSEYINQHKGFVFRALPNRDIILNYRFNEKDIFKQIKMKYFKFGLYTADLLWFYDETIEYYFCEIRENGSIETPLMNTTNELSQLSEVSQDEYFKINNSFIYEKLYKYEDVEKIISEKIKKDNKIIGKLL